MPDYLDNQDTTETKIEETIKPSADESSNVPSEEEQAKILAHLEPEYQLDFEHTQTKRTESLKRLKLYNNQKRDSSKVGDPLLFTVFQTVLASLYDDKLSVGFMGREEGDDEVAENLTGLAEYDYDQMGKDEMDYDWDWDACFFPGGGLVMVNEFDRKQMCPVGEVIDPMSFIRDPDATSVNGNQKKHGALRHFGIEISAITSEMKKHKAYFNVDKIKKGKDFESLKNEAKEARDEAQGRQPDNLKAEELGDNYAHNLLEWYTWYNGKKYLCTTANERTILVRFQEVKGDEWPLIKRQVFPMAHDWDGVTIPDLIEDKQRARSVMINLGMESAKADLYPMYLFDRKRIKNPRDLDFEFNKFVPVQGDVTNAVVPIQKSVFHQQVNLILEILDVAAQKAVAAPEVAQGVQPNKQRTLGETELVAQGTDSRRSLSARIFGWSEKKFWKQWYALYKEYFKDDIDEKTIRLQGPLAPTWRKLTRENIVLNTDPDISIESATIVLAKRTAEFQRFSQFTQIVLQDPTTNRRYAYRKLGKIMGMKKAELTLLIPPTIDELRAEDENSEIEDNKLPKVNAMDDHTIHMEIHQKAPENAAKLAHMEAHKKMMLYVKEHPEQFPVAQPMQGFSPIATPGQGHTKTQQTPVASTAQGMSGGQGGQ